MVCFCFYQSRIKTLERTSCRVHFLSCHRKWTKRRQLRALPLIILPKRGLHTVRNIVVCRAWSAAPHSLFLPIENPAVSPTGSAEFSIPTLDYPPPRLSQKIVTGIIRIHAARTESAHRMNSRQLFERIANDTKRSWKRLVNILNDRYSGICGINLKMNL